MATKLYDLEVDLSSGNAGVPRDSFKDWMRIRAFGHSDRRYLVFPVVVGSAFIHNDGEEDIQLRRGGAVPVIVGRGDCVHVMFDGAPNNMVRVG